MRTFGHEVVYTTHSRLNRPTATVTPGEIFQVYTQLNTGSWLKSIEDTYAQGKPDSSLPY